MINKPIIIFEYILLLFVRFSTKKASSLKSKRVIYRFTMENENDITVIEKKATEEYFSFVLEEEKEEKESSNPPAKKIRGQDTEAYSKLMSLCSKSVAAISDFNAKVVDHYKEKKNLERIAKSLEQQQQFHKYAYKIIVCFFFLSVFLLSQYL